MRCTRFSLLLLLYFVCQLSSANFMEPLCHGPRPGDCDPESCGGTCESRYIRFFDRYTKMDRTAKSCQCVEERICSIIGMNPHAGCRSYSTLSAAGQRLIRLWSIDAKERRYRFSNHVRKRFSDKQRHQQLLNGNSRFCCRSMPTKRIRSLRLQAYAGKESTFAVMPLLVAYLIVR